MIAYKTNNFNVDISEYLKFIDNVEMSSFTCPNCSNNNFERHGYYKRYIIVNDVKKQIIVLRIRCKCCGRTHAVLPPFIVPYLHTPIKELQTILVSIDNGEKLDVEPHVKKTFRRVYRSWIQKLLSIGCCLKDELNHLIKKASFHFRLCFMQIHRGDFFYISQSTQHDLFSNLAL